MKTKLLKSLSVKFLQVCSAYHKVARKLGQNQPRSIQSARVFTKVNDLLVQVP